MIFRSKYWCSTATASSSERTHICICTCICYTSRLTFVWSCCLVKPCCRCEQYSLLHKFLMLHPMCIALVCECLCAYLRKCSLHAWQLLSLVNWLACCLLRKYCLGPAIVIKIKIACCCIIKREVACCCIIKNFYARAVLLRSCLLAVLLIPAWNLDGSWTLENRLFYICQLF